MMGEIRDTLSRHQVRLPALNPQKGWISLLGQGVEKEQRAGSCIPMGLTVSQVSGLGQ